ncbi:MAG: hypothetical protein M1296_07435 [Chloroflexi bacterium]|nr:hypothetical protein [Chloroflexota bacterium]MCL4543556.1 hypothetical protein [Chloroflexota bacterium]
MSTGELMMTLVSLVTVAIVPFIVGAATGVRRGGGLIGANVIAAVISVWWAVYWAAIANPHHVKHTVLFLVLAGVALIAASFSRPVRIV